MVKALGGLTWVFTVGVATLIVGVTVSMIDAVAEARSPAAISVPGGWSQAGVLFIAVSPDGRLYRTEGIAANQVVRVETDGRVTVVAGGITDMGGMALDAQGNVFVSEDLQQSETGDNVQGRIVEYKAGGGRQVIATVASPTSLAVDPNGVVYVVRSSPAIRRSNRQPLRSGHPVTCTLATPNMERSGGATSAVVSTS